MSTANWTATLAAAPRDSLGCAMSTLSRDEALCAPNMVFRRKAADGFHEAHAETPPEDRGLLIGISMVDGHRRRIREAGRRAAHAFDRGDIYIRDFDSGYVAEFEGCFDFVLIELDADFLVDADRAADVGGAVDLARLQARADPTLRALAEALLPALERPGEADALFVEQMSVAIGAHLIARHRGRQLGAPAAPRPLGRAAIRRAQEMLMAEGDRRVTIAEVAEALNLPRNRFFEAFRETTGATPYQWLLNQRIDHARRLLRTTDLPLSEVALHCGFADQSHFTRIFSRVEGMPPGRWRARAR